MKITMVPSEDQSGLEFPQHSVTIETPSDELTLDEVGDLLRYLLLAWSFHPRNVDELLPST